MTWGSNYSTFFSFS